MLINEKSKIAFVLSFVILFTACHPCDPPATIDNGTMPDQVLNLVPYQNAQTYKFRHSAGLIIEFASARQSREEWLRCEECCSVEVKFEVNTTTLIPDYPIFTFSFDLSNMDTVNYSLVASVGYYQFFIPTNINQSRNYEFYDSVMINKKFYRDVFKLKSNYGYYYDRDTIFADSMYYSYERGIIQIKMSNGEKYSIYE